MVRLMTLSSVISPMAVPSLLVSKAKESVVLSSLAVFVLAKVVALSVRAVPSLTVSGTAKSTAVPSVVGSDLPGPAAALAVPSFSGSGVTTSMTMPRLVGSAVAKSTAVRSAVSRADDSRPVSSVDVLGVAGWTVKLGLLVTIVAKRLAVPSLVVSRVAKSIAVAGPMVEVALCRCSRGLGIPLDRGLPLPGEALVVTWAAPGTGCF